MTAPLIIIIMGTEIAIGWRTLIEMACLWSLIMFMMFRSMFKMYRTHLFPSRLEYHRSTLPADEILIPFNIEEARFWQRIVDEQLELRQKFGGAEQILAEFRAKYGLEKRY